MPVVGIPVHMLLERIATRLDRESLVEHLQHLGCDVEGYALARRFRCERCDNMTEITETEHPPVLCDRCGADYKMEPALLVELGTQDVIRMELLAVRPDMFDPGGLARVLRTYLGETDSPREYVLALPKISVTVAPELGTPVCPRPAIACAVIRGVTLDDDRIKVLMKLQENLHWAMGRDRKHASVGVYDLDTLQGTAFRYRSVGGDEFGFVPLGYDPARAEHALTPARVLAEHPKGKAYARLLEHFQRYPLLCDQAGGVLSMPPIINSELTRVRKRSMNLFVDVTGTGERLVEKALNVLTTAILELCADARAEQVTIAYPGRERVTPDLTPQMVTLEGERVERVIGVRLTTEELAQMLRKMGHRVSYPGGTGRRSSREATFSVEVPAYRNDVMHPVDLCEDVAIAYGYHNIIPTMVPTMTVGQERVEQRYMELARRVMCGLGFLEVITLILSSEEADFDALELPRSDRAVQIAHPISVEQTIVRTTLLSGLLDTFAVNASHPMPQHIFEVGNVSLLDAAAPTGAKEWPTVAGGVIGPKADYASIRSACAALLRELGCRLEAEASASPCFIAGRGAQVIAARGDARVVIGQMGELHPKVLERHKLIQPAAVFEVDLAALIAANENEPIRSRFSA